MFAAMMLGGRTRNWAAAGASLAMSLTFLGLMFGFEQQTSSWKPAEWWARASLWGCGALSFASACILARQVIGRIDPKFRHFRKPRQHPVLRRIPGIHALAVYFRIDYASRHKASQNRINGHLLASLAAHSGATIVTRDLTWCSPETEEIAALCRSGDLTILSCSQAPSTALMQKLQEFANKGANVKFVKSPMEVRLTIYHSSGTEVLALARPHAGGHTIVYSYDPTEETFALAKSLVYALQSSSARQIKASL